MPWQKLGCLFVPTGQVDWMKSHASVPFALHRGGDVFRVFFSGRDTAGRSVTGWFDVDVTQPGRVLDVAAEPVLRPGRPGEFDDSGSMLSWITSHDGTLYAYYIGWNLSVTVPFRNSLGLAVSTNSGETFERHGRGPILDRGLHDPCFVASACVLVDGGVWRMWYLSCVDWERRGEKLVHRYHLKYAESRDGVDWQRRGVVCIDFKSPAEYAISRPSVVKDGDTYRMWYSCRGDTYRIGYAESADGIGWRRLDERAGIDVSPSGWDSAMIEYPHVFDHAGRRYLLYNGNDYGRSGVGLAVLSQDE